MQFISLRIHVAHNRVVASGGLVAGNTVADGKERIEWRNGQPASNRRVFLVRFFQITGANQVPIWPFPEGEVPPNQQCVDTDNIRWLRVAHDRPSPPLRDDLGGAVLKYEVHVEAISETIRCLRDTTVEPLDPMIIIRSKNFQRDSVAIAVTSAVLGALVGALLVAWWT